MVRVAQTAEPKNANEIRVTLDKVEFDLIPEELPHPDVYNSQKIDSATANDYFRQAYRMVYHEWPESYVSLGKDWAKVVENSKAAQMDVKSFILFIVAGYRLTHPPRSGLGTFPTVNLTAASSVAKVAGFKKACFERYNAADAQTLGMLLDIVLDDIEDTMLANEVSFGAWIVGSKLRRSGDPTPQFYENSELAQSLNWLAVESTYHDHILKPYIAEKFGNEAEQKHRHLVVQTVGLLRRRSTLASTVFAARSRVMKKAVVHVLNRHGLSPDCFTLTNEVVFDTYSFWVQLGLALQHWETLKAVRGHRHRLWH